MSGHRYITNSTKLFEDEDVDDETFLRNSNKPSTNPFENDQQQTFEQRRHQIEARTIDSTQRSLGLLYETEEVGKATATELAKQREQLEKSNRQLDDINATLRFSQKHLNGLKSVFGGLKNYLSGNRDQSIPISSNKMINSPSGSKISEENNENKPSMSPDEKYNSHPLNRIRTSDRAEFNENAQAQAQVSNYDQRLEKNLDEMCGSLSRLKYLATDLQGEIDTQNDLIDNMNYKIEDVDMKVKKQNKEMTTLLGKK